MRRSTKRKGLPPRGLVPRLTTRELKAGYRYYWQPSTTTLRTIGKPEWLKVTPLGKDLHRAMVAAARLNAKLEHWKRDTRKPVGEVDRLILAFIDSRDFRETAPRTQHDYQRILTAMRDEIGDLNLADIDRTGLERYHERMTEQHGKRQGLYRMQMIRRLFYWAPHHGFPMAANPATKLGLRNPRGRQTLWTLDQLRELVGIAPPSIKMAVRLALYTCQRQGDVLRMGWAQYDPAKRALDLVQSKTGKRMILPLCPRLRAALRASRPTETFVVNQDGLPYTESGFRSVFRRYGKKVAPGLTFNDIRATCTSLLSEARLSDQELIFWTGHGRQDDARMLDVYIRRRTELAASGLAVMRTWRV